uniref:Uncharacterized protein n=1 Tax=Avena sativa TaxID=4498 RepID=A0ACD5UQB9_AVESA
MAPLRAATATLLLLTLASSATATTTANFKITEVLSESPEFSTFNSLLSKMNLTEEINDRQTITVLVVDDSAANAITSLPADTQKNVLAVHILLDYYDPMKLDTIEKKTALLTTLFQTTGAATNRMGLVNYTQGKDEQMAFGSGEPGAPISSQLVKVVACRPYHLSVMQISAAIIPPSIGSSDKGPGSEAKAYGSSPNKTEAPEASARTTEAQVQELESSDDASALDENDPSIVVHGPPAMDALASSQPPKSADAAKAPAAGNTVVVCTSVGLMGLVMLMILNS